MKLKRISTLEADRSIVVASKTGKMKGDIFFSENFRMLDKDSSDVVYIDDWLMCLPAKQLVSFMCHPTVYEQMREYLR